MIKKQPVRKRPKNLNLFTIRIPVNAVVSILHRASGVLLFLVLPVLLWCWQVSLTNEMGYWHMEVLLQHWFSKLLMIGLAWAFFHHFFAGLRHLGMDVHLATSLQKARVSSRLVLIAAVTCTMIFAIWVW